MHALSCLKVSVHFVVTYTVLLSDVLKRAINLKKAMKNQLILRNLAMVVQTCNFLTLI